MLSKLNVDDLDTSNDSKIKVVIARSTFDSHLIAKFSLQQCIEHCHSYVRPVLAVLQQANQEFAQYSKFDSCLKRTSPNQLEVFSNQTLVKELSEQCPLFHSVATGACKDATDLSSINANKIRSHPYRY